MNHGQGRRKAVWTVLLCGVGAIPLGGMMIATTACGCDPAELTFMYMLDYELGKKRNPAYAIDRASVIGRVPLGTPLEEFQRHMGIINRLNSVAKCSTFSSEFEIQCIVRTETSWFSVVETYKQVQFRFDTDSKLKNVRVDAFTCRFSTLIEPADGTLQPTPKCDATRQRS